MAEAITITVNSQARTVPSGTSVRQLIEIMGLGAQACAAEVNKSLVARRAQDAHQLREGDKVELVTLVGGG